ncbi:SdrD B-like domain-containing protein [Gardnerella vaginalis]|uniref:SdrD B-like domain-containing protein n=1 Tax=Gardnerella vaginalis TaxID=2702 RepID=UPI0039F10270
MKMKIVTASLLTATLLTASLSSSALAQPSNDNAFTNHENIPTNKSSIGNMDLIPAPTQHFGKSDGKLPEVITSINYVDGDSTYNHANTNKTNKILRPGSKLTLRATAKFTVPEDGDVFRPYLRIAIPKILTVDVNNFAVNAGSVASKVAELSDSSTFANYNLFDVYFNYNEWSSDFATEMPHLASIKGVNHFGNVLSNGDVIKNNQTVFIEIPTVVNSNANTSDLVDLQNYKKGVKPLIQGRVSYMPLPKSIDYTSEIGGIEKFQNDPILKNNPCLVRSDLVTGWKGQGDYGFWFTGLAMETSGVDYEGRHTAVRSLKDYTFNQLIPADLEYNQFVTIRRNNSGNNPIKLRLKIPFGSKNYALNGTKQVFEDHHLTVFRWPNASAEARNLMENAGIDKVQYGGEKVFGDTLPEKSFADWGTYGKQNRPAELFVSGVFNSDSTVFGPDDINKGIWLQGNSKASITTYYESPSCESVYSNSAYSDEELAYPPIISKIQETVATYARSDRSKVSTVPIEIVIPASLSGRVWFDANHNGIQDKGESSIIGAKVQLVKQYGDSTVIDINGNKVNPITTTSPDGSYEFTNLLPGNYVVKFTLPEGSEYFGFTYTRKGSDSSVDSDAIPGEPVTDRSVTEKGSAETDNSASKDSYVGNISLSAGEDKKHIDAGAFKKDEPKDPKKDEPKDPKDPKDPKKDDPEPKDNPKDPDNKPKPNPEPKKDEPKKDEPNPKDKPKEPNYQDRDVPDPKPDDPKPEDPKKDEPKDTNPKSEDPKNNEKPKDPESKPDDPKPDTPKDPGTDDTESNDPPQHEDPQPKEDPSEPNHSEIRELDNPIPSMNNDLDSNNSQSNESSFDNNNADSKQERVRDKLVNTGVSTVFTAVASVAMLALGATNKIKRYFCKGKHRQ